MARPKKNTTPIQVDETLINNDSTDTIRMYRNPSEHKIHSYDVPLSEHEDWFQFEWSLENKWL